mmetsp:Transcript_16134/g.29235  ORF Transcript_16134/g.29235 Transcript_16134/m.29235 type:complete len:98 (-) Transcript_16134:112-405(-)
MLEYTRKKENRRKAGGTAGQDKRPLGAHYHGGPRRHRKLAIIASASHTPRDFNLPSVPEIERGMFPTLSKRMIEKNRKTNKQGQRSANISIEGQDVK